MMTSPRTQFILPAILVSVLAILIFTAVGTAQNSHDETGSVRGAVVTVGPDGQSYNIPGATVRLKRNVQFAETIANDAGEYEFTNLPTPGRSRAGGGSRGCSSARSRRRSGSPTCLA